MLDLIHDPVLGQDGREGLDRGVDEVLDGALRGRSHLVGVGVDTRAAQDLVGHLVDDALLVAPCAHGSLFTLSE
jgi:hypothetical protein